MMNVPGGAAGAEDSGLEIHFKMNRTRDLARWPRDVALLEAELARSTERAPRTVFYLAETYCCLEEYEKAIPLYTERITLGGFADERFISALRIGHCERTLDRDPVPAFARAIAMCPDRAEPRVALSRHYTSIGRHEEAYRVALAADGMPIPEVPTRIFIDSNLYVWGARDQLAVAAFNVNRFEESIAICTELLAGTKLPPNEHARVNTNISAARKMMSVNP